MAIDKNTTIEDVLEAVPDAVGYLFKQGIVCIKCGEPIWGTLEEAAKAKGHDDAAIDRFVKDLNNMIP